MIDNVRATGHKELEICRTLMKHMKHISNTGKQSNWSTEKTIFTRMTTCRLVSLPKNECRTWKFSAHNVQLETSDSRFHLGTVFPSSQHEKMKIGHETTVMLSDSSSMVFDSSLIQSIVQKTIIISNWVAHPLTRKIKNQLRYQASSRTLWRLQELEHEDQRRVVTREKPTTRSISF